MRELLLGATLGLTAGVAPGPLLALLLSTTLRGGLSAGARVAAAPVLSDLPVIVLTLTVLTALPSGIVTAMTAVGALFLLCLGVASLRDARTATLTPATADALPALRQAALVNLLNPHPWLFWTTVGAPTLLTAWSRTPLHAVAFVLAFYATFAASKLAIALAVSRTRSLITEHWYRRLLALTACLLLAAALLRAKDLLP